MSQNYSGDACLPQVRRRHWGRWITAIIMMLLLFALFAGLAQGNISYKDIPQFLVSDVMLEGLKNTLLLALAAQVMGIVIGIIIALMKISQNGVLRAFASGYIWIFRGLPVLLQLLLWYNMALIFPNITLHIPLIDFTLINVQTNDVMTAFVAAFLGLGLNESAYMAEIVRAGLKSVDKGQIEAAQSIGETPGKCMRRIILPQAMRVVIPPTGNDFINMLKGTSIVSVIGFVELIRAANNISSRNLQVMETLMAAAIWYMLLVSIASIGQYYLERHFDQSGNVSSRPGLLQRIGSNLVIRPFARRMQS
ncbi:ABC transporter permease [Izhakiella australiensis]|uniref:Glutamate/aspartate import permease protein GltK n=1 Tax=Izhakiella australiensis TaxID=1926881 RepID=A0A1S8YE30_9GAMM|nr:amino acid ABC transporter permease [Izhakiella australiensis]OON37018.1 ABC transporter permease [Izhakiella australiensis]